MGSLLSTPAEKKRVFGDPYSPSAVKTEPLYLDEVNAEPAAWSEEGLCRTIQRFLGLLPDSMASVAIQNIPKLTLNIQGEVLKNQQQYPVFSQRAAYVFFDIIMKRAINVCVLFA
eukprot:jgi/Phyca11/115966/e_gw1.29.226.1